MRATILALCVAACGHVPASPRSAPDFTLTRLSTDLADERVSSAGWRGRVVVLDFWASWCVPCRKELPALDALARHYAGRDVVFVAVNLDHETANARALLDELGISALVTLLDPNGEVADLYRLATMPTLFLIDKSGVTRFVRPGYRPGDEVGIQLEIAELLR